MSQRRDRLKGIDNFYFGIQSWIAVRSSLMNIPAEFKWVSLWSDDDYKPMRSKCCLHFGLDWNKKEERGKAKQIIWFCSLAFGDSCSEISLPLLNADTFDNKLAHLVPTLVTMTQAVQDKLSFVCSAALESSLFYQVKRLQTGC